MMKRKSCATQVNSKGMKSKEELKKPSLEDSKIGRQGYGPMGQNWVESTQVAKNGRYTVENRIQGEDPETMIDTDVSQAV